jgi:DNA polymerase
MFVGQGAGAEEDQCGKPFQGRAGKLLREKIKPILETNELNIVLDNTIRARPLDNKGKNRAPTKEELGFCVDILLDRIKELKPIVIIPLGASATGTLLPKYEKTPISRVRGVPVYIDKNIYFPTFHPAAILHASEIEKKLMLDRHMVNDIKIAALIASKKRILFNSNIL